jgi:hypothetical protein
MIVVVTEYYNVMVNSEELIEATEFVMLYARCRTNGCRYNRVRPYVIANAKIGTVTRHNPELVVKYLSDSELIF